MPVIGIEFEPVRMSWVSLLLVELETELGLAVVSAAEMRLMRQLHEKNMRGSFMTSLPPRKCYINRHGVDLAEID